MIHDTHVPPRGPLDEPAEADVRFERAPASTVVDWAADRFGTATSQPE